LEQEETRFWPVLDKKSANTSSTFSNSNQKSGEKKYLDLNQEIDRLSTAIQPAW